MYKIGIKDEVTLIFDRGIRWFTYNYWITEEYRGSGERYFLFASEFMPECSPLYVIDQVGNEVEIFALAPGWI